MKSMLALFTKSVTLCAAAAVLLMLCATAAVAADERMEESFLMKTGSIVGLNSDAGWWRRCGGAIAGLTPCLKDYWDSIYHWKDLTFGRSCCNALVNVDDYCLSSYYPFSTVNVNFLRSLCNQVTNENMKYAKALSPNSATGTATATATARALFRTLKTEQCFASLRNIDGCLEQTVTSFLTGEVRILGPGCCKAVVEQVEEKCWFERIPIESSFSSLLRNFCASHLKRGSAPAPA